MDSEFDSIITVSFPDFIAVVPDQAKSIEFDIILDGEFSSDAYCTLLFSKIIDIGLSEFVEFLDYQCDLYKNPKNWLNILEKLIKLNIALFNNDDLKHRHTKLVSEIITKRHELKLTALQQAREKQILNQTSPCSGGHVYDFEAVLETISKMEIAEEKILYLKKHLKNYHQRPPEFEPIVKPRFDLQLEIEIKSIIEEDELLKKVIEKKECKKKTLIADPKGKLHCNTNAFIDLFYQMISDLKVDGNPILSISPSDLADIICSHFRDKDGYLISKATVLTVLAPKRHDKRPKPNRRFKINDMGE